MRIECFKNKRISKLLKTKDKYIQAGRVLSKKQEEIEQELKKLALQVQKIKDVVTPLVNEKIKELNLSELDEVAKVSVVGDEIELEVYDVVEEFTKNYLKKKREQANAQKSNTEGENKDESSSNLGQGGDNKEGTAENKEG